MDSAALLQDCRSYFERAQLSWDRYFSKWDVKAREEDIEFEDNLLPPIEDETVQRQTRMNSTARHLLKKSISVLNGKRFKSKPERKTKWKSERVQGGKSRDRKRETEIIHTTENQTNLECQVVNNKHFEADLKAIFIEILSENTNKIGMFSVLSRTFSGTGETISNFSLNSVIMEKNGFSISPVSKTVLHSASRNEFPLRGIPRGDVTDALGRSCVNVTERHASNTMMGHLPNIHLYGARQNHHRIAVNTEREEYVKTPTSTKCDSFRRLSTPTRVSYSPGGSAGCLSPEAIFKMFRTPTTTTTTTENVKKKCFSERVNKRKRRNKSVFESSSDDDSEDGEIDSSPRRVLKIFCTPHRSKRSIKTVTDDDDDDDDCFRILDRVKTDKS